jgi:hypothetical protein
LYEFNRNENCSDKLPVLLVLTLLPLLTVVTLLTT